MPIRPLSEFLEHRNVRYQCYNHRPTYTAEATAHALHLPGDIVAKTVLLRANDQLMLAVLPASEAIDLARFATLTGTHHVTLASEKDMASIAPLCDPGCLPPVGNLFGLPVYVAASLAADDVIAIDSGTHTESVCMTYADFEMMVQPRVMRFSHH